MKRVFLISLLIFFLNAIDVHAANWYVRPNGGIYGSENGADWSNAFDGFLDIAWTSVSCGDTIWVAGGNYTQSLNLQKKCTSGSRLYIRRARSDSSECTGVTGWSAGFDLTITQARAGIVVNGDIDYITVSGRTTESGGSYGWHINFSGDTSGAGIEFINGTDGDYNNFEYMDIQGPGYVTYSADGRGLDITPFTSPNLSTGNTFSHMKIWNWESGAYNVWADGSIFEYIEMYNLMAVNWQSFHPNGIYISNSSNGIVRYSNFHKETYATGEGIFFEQSGGSSNWQIYGNIFYDLNDGAYKAIEIQSVVPNLKIFNNTFDNVVNVTYGGSTYCGSGSEFRNNLQYYSSGGTCGTNSNNLTLTSLDPFVNRAGHDYHIVSTIGAGYPRNAGTNVSAYFTLSRDGVTFGGDGIWDIGAFEYNAAGGTPSPPFNLR